MIKFNGNKISDFYFNDREVKKVYKNNILTYYEVKGAQTQVGDYLAFVALESGTFKFSNAVEYSLDSGSTWVTLPSNTDSPTVESGGTIMWKAELAPSNSGIGTFSSSGRFSAEGNPMSLLYGDDFMGESSLEGKSYAFSRLFRGCSTLTSVSELVLPATTLSISCYAQMFNGCTSLTTAPQLLATTLAEGCYMAMFKGCTSLTEAPQLSATTLEANCYNSMFHGCTSLTTAPQLSATTLADFSYYAMFSGCTSLSSITCLATNISAYNATTSWVDGVAASGTFVKARNMNDWTRGVNGIPTNWIVDGDQEPCYAVVDDISQYQETDFVDVYSESDEKWYKLNNLNQYEEYGVYGEGRNITYYDGKLTIDGDYEYMYSGGSWNNVGEVSGSSVIIKSPEYIERTSSYNGYCSLLEYLTEDTKIIIKHRQLTAGGGRILGDYNSNDNDDWRFFFYGSQLYYDFITQRKSTSKSMPMSEAEEWEVGNYYIKNTATSGIIIQGSTQTFSSRPSPMYIYHSDGTSAGESGTDYGQIYYIKIYRGDVLVRDFIPWTDMNDNYGLYDKVQNELVHTVGNMTASTVINDVEVGGVVYPMYYEEKQMPPDNLSFSSMTEAQSYECPWVGITADIADTYYIFDENYDWVTKYGLFEVSGFVCDNGDKYGKLEEKVRNVDDSWSSQVPPVYEKGDLIESASTDCQHDYPKEYLTFVALEDGTFKLSGASVDYSLDNGQTWTTLASNTNTPTVQSGNKIIWKAQTTPTSRSGAGRFSSSGRFSVEGNPMSLLYGDNFSGQTSLSDKDYAFRHLFSGCTNLVDAENLSLVATTLSNNCYGNMFARCTSLLTAPQLSATTLAIGCYYQMFNGCTSLNSITCLATDISASNCTSNWVRGVAANGTFYKDANMTWSSGNNGIPSNWTVLDYQP